MNGQRVLRGVAVCAVGVLLLAGSASAQWGGSIVVSNGVETGPGGVITAGVSAARCGNNVVTGFGDAEKGNRQSFGGYSVSSDGGKTFRDLGVLPVRPGDPGFGPDVLGFGGTAQFGPDQVDVSVACASANLFYYAAIYLQDSPSTCDPLCRAISVSLSKDGGKTWALPVLAASAFSDNHFLGSPSIAVDPTSSQRIYVAYFDTNIQPFDFSFPDCQGNTIYTLRLASSTNGGTTWTDKTVNHSCDLSSNPETQGDFASPKVVVSPGGKVYLTYEFRPFQGPGPTTPPNEIRFTQSMDHGATFGTTIVVSNTAIGNALPQIAVDRTGLRSRGEIYVVWSGARSSTSTDVLVSDSVNSGASFSFPRPISPVPVTSAGHFQTNPVVAVDNDGQVASCYYETPGNSPTSSSVYSYNCALSFNNTASWQLQHVLSSVPAGFDAVTSDFLLGSDGFFTAFELQTSTQRWVVGRKAD